MANLTLTIDEEVLRRARIRAIEQRTSVNAVVREFLESYSRSYDREQSRQEILKLARQDRSDRGPIETAERTWKRGDIYEERLGRYNQR